jgi:hypothetical protein
MALLHAEAAALTTGLEARRMRKPGCPDIVAGTRSADRSNAIPAPRGLHDPRDPWLRIGPEGDMALPLAGQPGHSRTASLRRQPIHADVLQPRAGLWKYARGTSHMERYGSAVGS